MKSKLWFKASVVGIIAALPSQVLAEKPCTPPTAQISPEITTQPEIDPTSGHRNVIHLKGGSSNSTGTIDSYFWQQVDGPSISLPDPSAANVTFNAPNVPVTGATLHVKLTVTGCGTTSSTTSTVNVTNSINAAPKAVATVYPLDDIREGSTVTLDGTPSTDPDGDPLAYTWTQVDNNERVDLKSYGATATFVAPKVPYPNGSAFVFRLDVNDGGLSNYVDKIVNVKWVNAAPTAIVSCPESVDEHQTAVLDGEASSDPDDGIATYTWSQFQGPPSIDFDTDPSAAKVTFTAPQLTSKQNQPIFKLSVRDNGGLISENECTVTINDKTAPTIVGADPITVEATSVNGAVVSFNPTATDLVDGVISSVNCLPASGSTFPLGPPTTVTCEASDTSSNTATSNFLVTVNDTIAPVVIPPGDISVEATGPGTTVSIGEALATDAVGVTFLTNNAPVSFPVGATTITWTARDAAGNVGNALSTVTVNDTKPPVFPSLADVTAETTSPAGTYQDINPPTANDLVDGPVTATCLPGSGVFPVGTTEVTCTASDKHSNSATATFNVIVNKKEEYGCTGLLPPYAPGKTYKVGSTIPLKWQYTKSGMVVATSADRPIVTYFKQSSQTSSDSPTELNDAGASGLQYDYANNTWQFNWKTSGLASGTYSIQIKNSTTQQTYLVMLK